MRWITGESNNYGRFSAPRVDELFQQQRREVDEAKRIKLVHEMQRAILDKAWWFQGLGWTRIEVRSSLGSATTSHTRATGTIGACKTYGWPSSKPHRGFGPGPLAARGPVVLPLNH